MSVQICQGIWKCGKKKGQRCEKQVSRREYCNYHHRMLTKKNIKKEEEKRKNAVNNDVFGLIRCHLCENNIDKSLSQVLLGCGHRYHYNCFMLIKTDQYGCIFNNGKCPECDYDIENEMGKECSICFENLIENIQKTTCGHFFHKRCLDSWFKMNRICPMCRKKL
jgi:hypothetical protein